MDLAQDHIVTLCGPTILLASPLHRLRIHSQSRECSVGKAIAEEDNVVTLLGHGKNVYGPEIHEWPQRDRAGGHSEVLGNLTLSTAVNSLFPNFHVHGFSGTEIYGPTGQPYGFYHPSVVTLLPLGRDCFCRLISPLGAPPPVP
ncbi:hypothetical protein MLD38_002084 [Melastoma candidum]|uniref:Uncharacterized protein n=1 Tax=Melastoma candidum TaxID=119954 RepID=A0ACB9SNX9_9MYRT|nr:hypothetical protein MLD38_002084 [Melastoma candidum]